MVASPTRTAASEGGNAGFLSPSHPQEMAECPRSRTLPLLGRKAPTSTISVRGALRVFYEIK